MNDKQKLKLATDALSRIVIQTRGKDADVLSIASSALTQIHGEQQLAVPDLDTDGKLYKSFVQAGDEWLHAGLLWSQVNAPDSFKEANDAFVDGRARPRVVLEFLPGPSASLQFVGTDPDGEPLCLQLFGYSSRPISAAEKH
jgi:hypothetical protein